MFNPLSNYYPEPVIHKDIVHETIEHAYQYAKASRYQDTVAAQQTVSKKISSNLIEKKSTLLRTL